MKLDFFHITERSGEAVTRGQISDMFHRYRWASEFCHNRRVLEVACGTGQGLGMLAAVASRTVGCDLNAAGIATAHATYGDRVPLYTANAEQLSAADGSFDVILMFEAIYYLSDVDAFIEECNRVLAPMGSLLLSSTNRDLFDFVPSLFSYNYYSPDDLGRLLSRHGFSCEVFGYSRTDSLPLRHRFLRPIRALARRIGLLPKTMRSKALLRRIIFGRLLSMPCDFSEVASVLPYQPPVAIPCHASDSVHRFLYVVATKNRE